MTPPRCGSSIPQALFSCSQYLCAEEFSYPAEDLYWFDKEKRWVCANCFYSIPEPEDENGKPTRGITLAEHIIKAGLVAEYLLKKH